MDVEYLSASRIQTWLQCPRKYKLNYVDRVPWEFTPVAMIFGTSIHAALEQFYLGLQSGTKLTAKELQNIFRQSWDRETQDVNIDSENPEAVARQADTLLEVFHDQVIPGTVVAVEKELRVPLIDDRTGEFLGVDLLGRIDLIEMDREDSPVIVDHKTLSRRPAETDYDYNIQLMAYSYAARAEKLIPPGDDLLLRIDALLKTKNPSFHQHHIVHSPMISSRFLSIAKEILKGIQLEVFPPNPGWYCKGCPVKSFCCLHT